MENPLHGTQKSPHGTLAHKVIIVLPLSVILAKAGIQPSHLSLTTKKMSATETTKTPGSKWVFLFS